MTEIQRYEVVESFPGFELRAYADHVLVTKPMPGSMGPAAYSAFGYLAGYIGGDNAAGQKIEMTAPVLQKRTSSGFDVSFVMPADMADPPEPNREGMRVEKVAGELVAAKRFSGAATDELFEKKAAELLAAIGRAGFEHTGEVQYARYNGPWTPPFLRRNEVLVAVRRPGSP